MNIDSEQNLTLEFRSVSVIFLTHDLSVWNLPDGSLSNLHLMTLMSN